MKRKEKINTKNNKIVTNQKIIFRRVEFVYRIYK